MVGGVGRAGREVSEEWLVRRQRLLLRYPGHRLVGHVLHEVVAIFGRLLWFDRRGALVQRRVPLVRLAADETVEILEAAAARGPCIERPNRTCFPHRHFVALAELCRGVAVKLQRPRQRRNGIGQHGAVSWCAGGDFGDAAHPGGMMIATGQQGMAGRRAEGGGVKAIELRPRAASFSAFGVRQGPPKALDDPNPASSIRMISTLGAPLGGRNCSIGGNLLSGSTSVRSKTVKIQLSIFYYSLAFVI